MEDDNSSKLTPMAEKVSKVQEDCGSERSAKVARGNLHLYSLF